MGEPQPPQWRWRPIDTYRGLEPFNIAREEERERRRCELTQQYFLLRRELFEAYSRHSAMWSCVLAFVRAYKVVVMVLGLLNLLVAGCEALGASTVLLVPFLDLYVDLAVISHFLFQLAPIWSFRWGPLTFCLSPACLLPIRLPWYIPFQKSYVAVTLLDLQLPQPDVLLALHLYPALYLYAPTLVSRAFTVSVSIISLSFINVPLQLFGFSNTIPLQSLLFFRLSDARLELVFLPGMHLVGSRPSAPGFPASHHGLNAANQTSTIADAFINVLATSWKNNNATGTCEPLVVSPGHFHVPAPPRFLSSFLRSRG